MINSLTSSEKHLSLTSLLGILLINKSISKLDLIERFLQLSFIISELSNNKFVLIFDV